ncbi:NAD(P)-dependent dehydrogenase, short-chain alcohol dehydrogenase family [Paenibacillus sp. UNCCL117]|uniref:SDR family NAD(P)-dependent oxidoreductase n=1 Tax=unclassified Paenibacillus TaxID=185978 RepID=UPI00088D6F9E|nr:MULTISPECIES: SDR family NAD(P)-dependent oxidoreductase [unclassified Paenibacillus]SDC13915.1 NAD(P)-dependent dehydrogenase, short-chain alcohol dehydrogenase family [Paenibacillus sp. cl123]SFW17182.1 NAD(P)-dependent dehydrogenase, short-chain alcohol dehydrogenase family [Paenibacillus sp. UNCCL117]
MTEHTGTEIAMITGASSGIGLELTRRLLSEGWEVVALNRTGFSQDDAQVRDAIKTRRLREYKADITDFAALRRALGEIKSAEARLDVLFNNAGGSFPELAFSKQGRELHYELQTVAPYAIMMELKELLKKGRHKTVVGTSTNAFQTYRQFHPEELPHPPSFRKLIGPYAATKLALSLWTREAAPSLAKEGILIRSVDPGANNTLRSDKQSGLPVVVRLMMKLFFPPPTRGASRLYEGAFGRSPRETGVYLSHNQVKELKFTGQGKEVLQQVQAIYEREFAGGQGPKLP